jgi:hypothetical protein
MHASGGGRLRKDVGGAEVAWRAQSVDSSVKGADDGARRADIYQTEK